MRNNLNNKHLQLVYELPKDPKGYGDVSINFSVERTVIRFEYGDETYPSYGEIHLRFALLFNLESENNPDVRLPERSDVIYQTKSKIIGFNKYVFWLSNNYKFEVECEDYEIKIPA